MDYSFNGDIAAKYGVDEAVFIHNLYWWIRKNQANGRHYKDGKTWTYNSIAAWSELFPFWSESQVRRIVDKLKNNGAILVESYNKGKFDHTKWYAISDEIMEIYAGNMQNYDLPKLSNQNCRNRQIRIDGIVKSTTDNIPDNIPDSIGRFTPPTLQEVQVYCMNRHNNVDPEKFIDFYSAKGWMIGKNKMKDWKAAVRTWEKGEKEVKKDEKWLD